MRWQSTTSRTQHITPSCIRSYYNVDYASKAVCQGNQLPGHFHIWIHQQSQQRDTRRHQIALSVGYPNPVSYLAVGPVSGNLQTEPFGDELVNFGNCLNSASNPPTSVSTSYGAEEQYLSSNYLDRICNEFMKAGSRGISVFFSSGDFGVGGNGEQNRRAGFYALFPASCPYISSHFSAPTWQSNDTTAYARNNLDSSYNGYYNPTGRGYPDVALVGEYYDIVLDGAVQASVYGTSASSPAWASLVSLINDQRISEGKATLGFLNPLLYSKGRSAFRDITAGNNRSCGTDGFPAARGWDPTTGLGTPNFSNLRQKLP
ncbi:family S53 protease-like protein, partial [Metarhizium majus ARSEF 297]